MGSFIALGWWVYGASIFAPHIRPVVIAAAGVLTAALLVATVRILQRVRRMPSAAPAALAAGRRAWRWFWLNLLGEIILLNVAVSLLGAPGLRVYWIPAISGIVGLHFLPMAVFFRTRSYWFVGIAMMAGAIVAAWAVSLPGAHPDDIVRLEALANAVILWSSLIFATMGRGSPRRGVNLPARSAPSARRSHPRR